MAYCITKSYGLQRIKATVPKWLAAMARGRDAAPRCVATAHSGKPCGRARMRGAERCHVHLLGAQRDALDRQRAALAQKNARSTNPRRRADGERTLAVIARRQLHRSWKLDPTLSGLTLVLPERDEARVRGWLKTQHGVEFNVTVHASGHPLSARSVDRLRWAGALALTQRITAEAARRRVVAALRDDAAWWRKHHGDEEMQP